MKSVVKADQLSMSKSISDYCWCDVVVQMGRF